MALADKDLSCSECNAAFVFTVGEQEFFNSRGYTNEPKRCPECRETRKTQQRGGYGGGPREMHPVVCAQCGIDTTVPFVPRGDRPVYCSDCFSAQRR